MNVGAIPKLVRLGVAMARRRPHPFSVTFILTHRCNFRCDYCDIPDAAAGEMTRAEFSAAIDDLADAGMARASFSGGEALLRPDAVAIIGHAKARGLYTSLNSNAWLTESVIDDLAPILDMLVVSLDGPEEVHDVVRRRRGSYERVVRVLERARDRGVATATITVLGPWNLDRVEEILELASKIGFWAYFQPAYSDCFEHESGLHPAFAGGIFDAVADRLEQARASGLPVGSSPTYVERLRRGPAFGDCSACAAGRYFGTVMPDGQVVPCHLTSSRGAYKNGREVGFARAFLEMPHPGEGPGCAITPYQENDLIFGLDRRAITAAIQRMGGRLPGGPTRATHR
jgi:MoaA/NifB/PqqE/SkfB family radical SAM enzyme